MSRRIKVYSVGPENVLTYTYKVVPLWRVARNFIVMNLARYCPSLAVKRGLYRMLGVKVGRMVSISLGAQLDWLFPQLITIGENATIGMDACILTHEFLRHEYRLGEVDIGADAVIGARAIILAGVKIGAGATVGAGSVVTKDVPPGSLAVGIPARVKKMTSGRDSASAWESKVGS